MEMLEDKHREGTTALAARELRVGGWLPVLLVAGAGVSGCVTYRTRVAAAVADDFACADELVVEPQRASPGDGPYSVRGCDRVVAYYCRFGTRDDCYPVPEGPTPEELDPTRLDPLPEDVPYVDGYACLPALRVDRNVAGARAGVPPFERLALGQSIRVGPPHPAHPERVPVRFHRPDGAPAEGWAPARGVCDEHLEYPRPACAQWIDEEGANALTFDELLTEIVNERPPGRFALALPLEHAAVRDGAGEMPARIWDVRYPNVRFVAPTPELMDQVRAVPRDEESRSSLLGIIGRVIRAERVVRGGREVWDVTVAISRAEVFRLPPP